MSPNTQPTQINPQFNLNAAFGALSPLHANPNPQDVPVNANTSSVPTGMLSGVGQTSAPGTASQNDFSDIMAALNHISRLSAVERGALISMLSQSMTPQL
jgi:hypothetical protein